MVCRYSFKDRKRFLQNLFVCDVLAYGTGSMYPRYKMRMQFLRDVGISTREQGERPLETPRSSRRETTCTDAISGHQ